MPFGGIPVGFCSAALQQLLPTFRSPLWATFLDFSPFRLRDSGFFVAFDVAGGQARGFSAVSLEPWAEKSLNKCLLI